MAIDWLRSLRCGVQPQTRSSRRAHLRRRRSSRVASTEKLEHRTLLTASGPLDASAFTASLLADVSGPPAAYTGNPLKDINAGAADSNPHAWIDVNGVEYFTADSGASSGLDLWKTDGTTDGTTLIASGVVARNSRLYNVDGHVVFASSDNAPGGADELWTSDGTAAGTQPLPGTGFPSSSSYSPPPMAVVGNHAYFVLLDGGTTTLWETDGTTSGTKQALAAGVPGQIGRIVSMDGKLYFDTYEDRIGFKIWASDGTEAGTSMVVDLGYQVRDVSLTVAPGGRLFLSDAASGFGGPIWTSDGSAAGTVKLGDFFNTGPEVQFAPVPGGYVFGGYDGVEFTDGTAAGTHKLAQLSFAQYFAGTGQKAYFNGDDGVHGNQLWVTDGTAAGTMAVTNINAAGYGLNPTYLTVINGQLFFSGSDGVHGGEPWISDGTAAGTKMIQDLAPGASNSYSHEFAALGNAVLFAASDGAHGVEPWVLTPEAAAIDTVESPAAVAISPTEGAAFSGAVATFSGSDPNGTADDFTATIDWGDGASATAGTITGTAGAYTVSGSHAYAEEGTALPLKIIVADSAGSLTTIANSTNVADAPLSITGATLSGQVNSVLSGALATFTDPGGAEPLAEYSATVDWGDGSSATAAEISGPDANGVFTVSGSHTYAAAGALDIAITLHHDAAPDATIYDAVTVEGPVVYASARGGVKVKVVNGDLQIIAADAAASTTPLAEVTSLTVNGAEGVANNFTLDYSGGVFVVPGGITFNGGALPATPSNSLTIVGGSFDTDTFNFSGAHDGSIQLSVGGQMVNYMNMTLLANTGTADNMVFQLPDGTVVGSLAGAEGGMLELSSSNGAFETTTFAAPSSSLTVNAGNGADTITAFSSFYEQFHAILTVNGAANTLPVHAIGAASLRATQGAALTATVADFTDPNGGSTPGDFTATIDWGDGQTSSGSVSAAGGTFSVAGSHAYASSGQFTVQTTVVKNGVSTLIDGSATVAASGTPHEQYIEAVFHDVLGRAADPQGLAYWAKQLDSGAAISSIAQAIARSDEYYANFVIKPAYLKLLGRTADEAGVQHWTQLMHDGLTDQQLEANFVSSVEFRNNASGTNTAWVDSIYKLLLGRQADASGEAYWSGQLAGGKTRLHVAESVAGSQENDSQLINEVYFHYLGRAADPDGLSFWLQQFADGRTNEDVIAGFTSSDEYYKEHTS